MQIDKIETVIFDWNGTLIDDVWLGVKAMNVLLEKRNMSLITEDYYREIFRFPVKEYYRDLGLDVDNEWEQISLEFMDFFLLEAQKVKLHDDVIETLCHLKNSGKKLCILSAMQHEGLVKQASFLNVTQHFDFIQGIDNHYAQGKAHLGVKTAKRTGTPPERILFVGDTDHDEEVAEVIGCKSALVSRGHNDLKRLKETKSPVYDDFSFLR